MSALFSWLRPLSAGLTSLTAGQPAAPPTQNFGANLHFQPQVYEAPRSESDVLDLLRRHRGRRLRVHASLHAWSEVAAGDDVWINVGSLGSVQIDLSGPEPTAVVGGGCRIQRLVEELDRQGWTMPSLGLITEQTIAGATSTATHGSGRPCLAHFIRALRVATYDASGEPVIRQISDPSELDAARCGIGNIGIITSLTLTIRPQYRIEEFFQRYDTLDAVLGAETDYPLQQFYLVPWNWTYFAQHRREIEAPRSRTAFLYRWYWTVGMDRGLHWIVIALARWLPDRCTPLFFRFVLPALVPRGWRVVDRSDRQLTMQHQLFRHIETEVLVPRPRLSEMLEWLRWLLAWSAGEPCGGSNWEKTVEAEGCGAMLRELRGKYRHHYPICIRKVLPDTSLLSASGGGGTEPWYAVSLISYARPEARDGFFQFTNMVVRLSNRLFGARPHWGKHCAIPLSDVSRLYPELSRFLEIRDQIDPTRAFLAGWLTPVQNLADV